MQVVAVLRYFLRNSEFCKLSKIVKNSRKGKFFVK